MRLGREDAVAAILVVLIVGAYIGFFAAGDVPERGMAVIGLVLGSFAYLASKRRIPRTGSWRGVERAGALISLALGIATLVSGVGGVLVAFVVTIVALWALVILRNVGVLPGRGAQQAEAAGSDDQRPPPPQQGPPPPPAGLWPGGG
jgi:uncharacterized membrane protein YfcA